MHTIHESNYTAVFFSLFAAAEPLVYVDVAHGTPGPALASAGPMQNLGAHSCEKWCYDVILLSQPWYDLFMRVLAASSF